MFRKRRKGDLDEVGVRAPGEVLEVRQGHWARQGNLGVESDTDALVHMEVRVQPEAEPAFEVSARLWIPLTQMPSPGSRVTVLYDPADHGRFSILDPSAREAAASAFRMFEERSGVDAAQMFGGSERLDHVLDEAVKNPRGAADAVRAALDLSPQNLGYLGGQPPAAPQPAPDRIEQLTQLAKLRDDGALTEAEFQAEKAKLLAGP